MLKADVFAEGNELGRFEFHDSPIPGQTIEHNDGIFVIDEVRHCLVKNRLHLLCSRKTERRGTFTPLTEAKVTKGGRNAPYSGEERPPAPQGSSEKTK